MKNILCQVVPLLIPKRVRPAAVLGPKISEITQNIVVSGPFEGMKYVSDSVGSVFIAKILGTYELELAPVIEKLCGMPFDTVIDAGAAEGYYAVGLAKKMPGSQIIAYEVGIEGQKLIREMTQLNGVQERVTIRGLCEAKSLTADLDGAKHCLLVMDIEGSEAVLLDPFIFPKLESAHILVELHDFVIAGMGEIISRRFDLTHDITEIQAKPRTIADFSLSLSTIGRKFPKAYVARTINEFRPPGMRWFYMSPKVQA